MLETLPPDALIVYPYRYKGAGLQSYTVSDLWVFQEGRALVITPGPDFDRR